MKAGDRRYTILWHCNGQPRPYAATVRDFTLKVEWWPRTDSTEWAPNDLSEGLVDKAAKAIGCNYYTRDEKPEWHQPILKSKSKIGLGEWRYRIEEEYTD